MPCFKGVAVSVHADGAPIAEYGIQKQSRVNRISSYIPVPPPTLNRASQKHEPAKFAISITLLTPGLAVPYSTPKPSSDNPHPRPQRVGAPPASSAAAGPSRGIVSPYMPITHSEHETVAAYIYFDGRSKEEVATLLRPGEETWVNSRWVQTDGGGLAEREFLFREVGLESWLNGLDLETHDANTSDRIERRRQKFERRRRGRDAEEPSNGSSSANAAAAAAAPAESADGDGALRYGPATDASPTEAVFGDSELLSSDDEEPPEAAGQIKICMFRVVASGEVKRGEYSPQFDAAEDDDDSRHTHGGRVDTNLEHTTSFAKPRSLDPRTISTQTVTGLDLADRPYATFTFFYRAERQLEKIGIVPSSRPVPTPSSAAKRRSGQLDFGSLGPLSSTGTVGFTSFRDQKTDSSKRRKAPNKSGSAREADSDDEEDEDDESPVLAKLDEVNDKDVKPDRAGDVVLQRELADKVGRIRLKRQHSADPDSADSPGAGPGTRDVTPPKAGADPAVSTIFGSLPDDAIVGSPLKKPRSSLQQGAHLNSVVNPSPTGVASGLGLGIDLSRSQSNAPISTEALGGGPPVKSDASSDPTPPQHHQPVEDEEEL